MKTQEQITKSTHRSSAEEQVGKSGRALTAPLAASSHENVIQRSQITLYGKLLPGSIEEKWSTFWEHIIESYTDDFRFATALRDIIVLVSEKGEENLTEWDKKVRQKAFDQLAIEADYIPHEELTNEQSGQVKEILSDKKMDEADEPVTEIDSKGMTMIVKALENYTINEYKKSDKNDSEDVDIISGKTNHDTILQRAIFDICNEYGMKMKHAEILTGNDTASKNLNNAKLKHSKERFKISGDEEKVEAAREALYWVMASIGEVSQHIDKLEGVHTKSSSATIRAAYAEVILASKENKKMLDMLAEVRLKWGPITYGSNIYLQVLTDRIKVNDQWELYQTIIHEALHSAEHPLFYAFLQKYIPDTFHSDIREGTVEYLTMKIWGKILARIKEGKGGDKPATGGGNLTAAKGTLTKMKSDYQDEKSQYKGQWELIQNIVKALENGESRLEAAYFYGNVGAFLPKNL